MTYPEILNYLFTRLPMFSKQGVSAYKKDLTNTIRLCEALGNPQKKLKTLHIAGTNGKGSTSHMLAAVLQAAGYKTGLYTSPHLKDFRERIKINGEMCSEEFVMSFTEKIKPLIEEIQPSFFEITVVMALEYFVQQQVDIAVIEVGLGGRLDSTNIIMPELSIITNISYDHMYLLGNSLQEIAFEKAGIIKRNIPVIIGEAIEATRPVFEEQAATLEAPIIFAQQKLWVSDYQYNRSHLKVQVANHTNDERETFELDLPGLYQSKNLLSVLEAIKVLRSKGWHIGSSEVHEALKNVKKLTGLYGRWDVIHSNPAIVLDVGHNEDGIKEIVKQIEVTTYHHLHIVMGFVKDKEIQKVLSLLPKYATYYYTKAAIERALPEDQLAIEADKFGLRGQTFEDVNVALQTALSHANNNDLIIVCGSVFVVGEVNKEHLHFHKH